MDTIVLADAHFDATGPEVDHFITFLFTLPHRNVRTLYILGDLFTVWVGASKMQLPHHQAVLEAFREVRHRGVRVAYIEGNRDYFLASGTFQNVFAHIATEYIEEGIGQRRFHFAHGDLVNLHDKQYRAWRRISRNPVLYRLFQCVPAWLALRIVHYLERRFRSTNTRHKSAFPLEVCQQYTQKMAARGNDVVILGHFHEIHQHELQFDGRPVELWTLPAWQHTGQYFIITEQGEMQRHGFPSTKGSARW